MSNTVVTQLIIDGRGAVQGAADTVRATRVAQEAYDALIDRNNKLQGTIDKTTATLTRGAGSISTIERQWRALQASVDPIAGAQQKAADAIERATLRADAAVRRLGVSQADAAAVVAKVAAAQQANVQSVTEVVRAQNDNSAALARMRAQYDPVFAAELRRKEALKGINEALQAGAINEGLAADARRRATSEMNDTIQKLERLAETQKRAAQAAVNRVTIVPDRAADIAAYGKSLDDTRARFDPLFKATREYRQELADLREAYRTGAIPTEALYQAALGRTKSQFEEQVRGIRGLGTATQEVAAVVQRSAAQMQAALDAAGRAGSAAYSRMQANVSAGAALGSLNYGSRGGFVDSAGQDTARAKYDQLFAAGQRYKQLLVELRADLATGAISESTYAAALDRTKTRFVEQAAGLGAMTRAQREAADAAERAAKANRVNAAGDAAAREAEQYAAGLRNMRLELVPAYAAIEEYRAAVAKASQGLAAGIINQDEYAAAIARARARQLDQTNELRKADEANARVTRGVGLNAYAWQNLSFQINDVVTSLASGISPMQTLAQQGGQIFQVLQGAQGGVVGGLKAVGQALLSLAGPVGIIGGLALSLGAAAVAAIQFSSAQNQLKNSLLGTGQAAGLSVDQLGEIARQAAESSKITVGAARDIERAFLRSGVVVGEAFLPGIEAVKNLSKATGVDMKTSAEQVAQMLGKLKEGDFAELSRVAGNFGIEFSNALREALKNGDQVRAQVMAVRQLNDAYKQAAENASWYERVWSTAINSLSRNWERFGRQVSGAGETQTEQLRKIESTITTRRSVQESVRRSGGTPASDPILEVLESKAEELRREQRTVADVARKNGIEVQRNIDQLGEKIIETQLPDITRYKNINQQLAENSKNLGAAADARDRGVAGAAEKVEQLKLAGERLKQQSEDVRNAGAAENVETRKALALSLARLQATRAVTPEEKAAAAAAESLASSIGTVTSASERRRAADDAMRQATEQNKAATEQRVRVTLSGAESQDRFAEALKNSSQSMVSVNAVETARQAVQDGSIAKADEQRVREAELAKGLADSNRARAESIRTTSDDVAAQEKRNAAVRNGTQTSEQASKAAEIEKVRSQGLRDAAAAEGETRERLTRTVEQQAEGMRQLQQQQDASAALAMTEQTERQIKAIRDEIDAIGKSREEQAKTIATRQAMIDLMSRGIDVQSAEGQGYIAAQQRLAGYRTELQKAQEAQQRMMEGQRAIGDAFTGFIDNLVSGSGKLTDALSGLARTFTSGGLQAIFTGTGPFAEMFGTASGDPNKTGGLFGGILPGLKDAVKQGSQAGSSQGVLGGFGSLFQGVDTKQVMGVVGGAMGIIGAYGAGAQAKSTGGAALSGALSGGVGGFMLGSQIGAIGGPIGAIAGAAVGGLMAIFGNSAEKERKKKEQLQQYKDQYEQAKPQIEQLSRTLRGAPLNGAEATIESARLQMVQAAQTAAKGQDQATATRIEKEWYEFRERLRGQVRDAMDGTMKEIAAGFGPQGPFATAAQQVHQLGDAMRAWLDDVNSATGAFSGEGLNAIFRGLLATLQPTPQLTATAKEYQRIQGTAAGLQQELVRLGITSEQAATAIREGVGAAMQTLRDTFNKDLDRKINEASGKDYLNDVADLIKEVGELRVDANTIGGDLGRVNTYFTTAAQQIVNDSELTGDAFRELTAKYPELIGAVKEFAAAAEEVAVDLEAIAARVRGFQDRLFAATNDNTTLEGQLRAFDRAAAQERADETKAGGQAMADLEAALAAERLKVINDFGAAQLAATRASETERLNAQIQAQQQARQVAQQNYRQQVVDAEQNLRQAYSTQAQTLQTTIDRLKAFTVSIRQFRDSLLVGASSPLGSYQQFLEAQRQFRDTAALAGSGDEAAQAQLQQMATAYLDTAKTYYASSTDYARAFDEVQGVLTSVADSSDAMADAQARQLTLLQQQVSKLISIDNGVDTVEAAIQKLIAVTAQYAANRDYGLDPTRNKAIVSQLAAQGINYNGGFGNGEFGNYLSTLDPGQRAIADQVVAGTASLARNWGARPQANRNIVTDLNALGITFAGNFGGGGFQQWKSTLAPAIAATVSSIEQKYAGMNYQQGGIVGNGRWNQDSVLARYQGGGAIGLAGGEFVVPAPMVPRYIPELAQMRSGSFRAANTNADSMGPVIAELRAIRQAVLAGASETVSAVRDGNEQSAKTERELKRRNAS